MATASGHLSIGEVLALLLEEFPDVTISKIRFLESQGLIDPERTASGYRKFYANDVDLLRCILREQRENYLPLRVIKDRIEAGEIDPTNETPRPRGIVNVPAAPDVPQPARHPSAGPHRVAEADVKVDEEEPAPTGAAALFMRTSDSDGSDPAKEVGEPARPQDKLASSTDQDLTSTSPSNPSASESTPAKASPGERHTRAELRELANLSSEELEGLESYGVVAGESVGGDMMYDDDALEIATISKRFLDAGVDARHLRGWRVAAEREVGLLEQLIQPLLRQRNPDARARAVAQLAELQQAGGELRTAMMQSALRHHTSS